MTIHRTHTQRRLFDPPFLPKSLISQDHVNIMTVNITHTLTCRDTYIVHTYIGSGYARPWWFKKNCLPKSACLWCILCSRNQVKEACLRFSCTYTQFCFLRTTFHRVEHTWPAFCNHMRICVCGKQQLALQRNSTHCNATALVAIKVWWNIAFTLTYMHHTYSHTYIIL